MQDDQPLDQFIPIEEVINIIGLQRNTIYTLIKKGELKSIKIGARTVFSRAHIRQWMDAKIATSQEAV